MDLGSECAETLTSSIAGTLAHIPVHGTNAA